jgi:complement component 1 Q subcomponent-binding protein
MAYFPDAALAEPKTYEAEVKRRPVYGGPPFGDLDEELQLQMQEYLANRGINDALAGFVAEYIDYKEQAEYVRWLTSEFAPIRSDCGKAYTNMMLLRPEEVP